MRSIRRGTWTNHTGNQVVDPLRIYEPRSLDELVAIVRDAERDGTTVRAVGSGHSWSDCALSTGFLVRPTGLARPMRVEAEDLKPEAIAPGAEPLVRTQAGIRLKELNAYLASCRPPLALSNMGGYDHQTVAGVLSTATHGSGIGYGPIADFTRSLDVVASGGRVIRIEPSDGITDPAAYARNHPGGELRQDDQWFRAAKVGVGCLGIVHSAFLAVEPAFWLKEVRTLSTWRQVRTDLASGSVLADNRHYEVLFSPYPREGDLPCLITTRNPVPTDVAKADPRRTRNWLVELASSLPFTPWVLNFVADHWPQLSPRMLYSSLTALANDDYTNVSYDVLNIGAANVLPAYSAEIGVPMDGRHLEAVDRIAQIAEQHRRVGNIFHTAPISLRFVRASDAYLSMMHGRDTMMIELILMTKTEGGFELLAAYEDALYALGGRPHWGQVNTLTGSGGLLDEMYPALPQWREVHADLNSSGVFDSPFSKRVGLSPREFAR